MIMMNDDWWWIMVDEWCLMMFDDDLGANFKYCMRFIPSLPNTFWVGIPTPKHLLTMPLGCPNISSQAIWIILEDQGMFTPKYLEKMITLLTFAYFPGPRSGRSSPPWAGWHGGGEIHELNEIHEIQPGENPWDWYILPTGMVDFYGFHVGKTYTIHESDMGK